MNPPDRRRVAIHESAHAVAATAMGFDVTRISLSDDGRSGLCEYTADLADPLAPRKLLVVMLAGSVADELSGRKPEALQEPRARITELVTNPALRRLAERCSKDDPEQEDDALTAARLLKKLPKGDRESTLQWAACEAEGLIRERCQLVEAVAKEILDGTLTLPSLPRRVHARPWQPEATGFVRSSSVAFGQRPAKRIAEPFDRPMRLMSR